MSDNGEETNNPVYKAADRGTDGDNGKKKKMIIGGVVGVIVLVVIILIIVFATGKGGNHPHHNPNDPQDFQEDNHMMIKADSVKESPFSYSVLLEQGVPPAKKETLLQATADQKKEYKPVDPSAVGVGVNNEYIKTVKMSLELPGQNLYYLKIQDDAKDEYTVPPKFLDRPPMSEQTSFNSVFNATYATSDKKPFTFSFSDRSSGEVLLKTENRKFVMQDKFKELGFQVKSTEVYGLGMSNKRFLLESGAYSMYSKTRVGGSEIDQYLGGQQGPAVHPFLMFKTDDGQFAGVYFPNSAPAQFELIRYEGYEWSIFNYITIGGAVEMYFIMPDTPDNVIQTYQKIVGLPAFPPMSALGFYQGSDSYSKLTDFAEVDKMYKERHYIVEGYNLDNYNMNGNQIFTIDNTDAFKGIEKWVQELQADGRSIVLGLIEGIATDSQAYKDLAADDALLMSGTKSAILQNYLKNTFVAYPDWYNEKTSSRYAAGLAALAEKLTVQTKEETAALVMATFTGVSLKDNTSFGYCDFECYPKTAEEMAMMELVSFAKERRFLQENPSNEEQVGDYKSYTLLPNDKQKEMSVRDTPFQMGAARNSSYGSQDVGIDAIHPEMKEYKAELFYHNLNGYAAAQAIHNEMASSDTLKAFNDKRPFIMSDNTFPGAGQYTGSWLSNYRRTWADMKNSIAGVFNLNMFGVLTAGTEICGSLGKFDAELCGRWAQNAVLMPAVRNYYNATFYNETSSKWETNPKGELYNINQDTEYEYELAANGALKQRYKFMQYIYTEMFKAHKSGKPYVHPVFFDQPQNKELYSGDLEDSYMAGDALHVSTVLHSSTVSKEFRSKFPTGNWTLLSDFMDTEIEVKENANNVKFTPMIGDSTVHLKQGKSIPYQKSVVDVVSTKQLLSSPSQFIIYRDAAGYSEGHFFLDDGSSKLTKDNHALWKFRHAAQTITFFLEEGSSKFVPQKNGEVEMVRILRAGDLADIDFACSIDKNNAATQLLPIYNPGNQVLEIRTIGNKFFTPKDISKVVYGNSKKDINLCDQEKSFKYKAVKKADPPAPTPAAKTQSMTYHIQNIEVPTEQLYVTFKVIDQIGTVKITYSMEEAPKNDPTDGMVDETEFTKAYKDTKIQDLVTVREDPFQFVVHDMDGNVLYSGDALMFFDPKNKYIMTHAMIPVFDMGVQPIFGLGGRTGDAMWPEANSTTITLWNSHSKSMDYQPFYIFKNLAGKWTGVFDLSTNAMDYNINSNRTNSNVIITHITTAQNLHKYILSADTPNKLVMLYQQLVGLPVVPPEWAFGWGHFKDGIASEEEWMQIQKDYSTGDFPIDHLWLSIDYTENFEAFTVSTEKYPQLKDSIDTLHYHNIKVIPVIESGISMNAGKENTAHTTGTSQNVFIESADGKAAVGSQHGNKVNYPDPTKSQTATWWKTELENFQKAYSFDGIWLSKNDLWNECDGFCSPYNVVGKQLPMVDIEHTMGYIPGDEDLNAHSLDVSAKYSTGTEFDLHNRFPREQAKITYDAFSDSTRPLIMSSGSIAGQGKFGASWTDNNFATERDMRQSIQDLYMSNIFGMPYSGSDICGFYNDPNRKEKSVDHLLCTRWYMLAAFQPFSRNGGGIGTYPKAPYLFKENVPGDDQTTLQNVIRVSMNVKYNLLRYVVSFFHGIAAKGGAFYKPLWFDYPNDYFAYLNTDQNTMLGESIKVSFNPSMKFLDGKKDDISSFYFPEGKWCQIYPEVKDKNPCSDFKDGHGFMTGYETKDGKQVAVPLQNSFEQFFVHMKAGAIVPYQEAVGDTLNASGLSTLPTSYRFGTPTTEKSHGFVAFDDDGSGSSAMVRTYSITQQLITAGANVEIQIEFAQTSGPAPKATYEPAKNTNEHLGKLYFYDVAGAQKDEVHSFNYCDVIYLKSDGTLGKVGKNSEYKKETQSITFDFSDAEVENEQGINIAYVKKIQVRHAVI